MKISNLQNTSAMFRIRGPDANTFLSGQFTQEIRGAVGLAAYGLWLNQKGKVLADSNLLKLGEDEFLAFGENAAPDLLRQRWEDYLIADDVTLADESAAWGATLIQGASDEQLAQVFGRASVDRNFISVDGSAMLFPAWGRAGWHWLLTPRDDADGWQSRLRAAGEEVPLATLMRERLLAGVPAVPLDIGPEDLPNEGGLDATAISFTKGCYLGQEVMARLKSMGQVRRRLHVVRGAGTPPAPKTPLMQAGKRVGETRSAAQDGEGFVAFAMLSLVNFDPAAPLELAESGARVEVLSHG